MKFKFRCLESCKINSLRRPISRNTFSLWGALWMKTASMAAKFYRAIEQLSKAKVELVVINERLWCSLMERNNKLWTATAFSACLRSVVLPSFLRFPSCYIVRLPGPDWSGARHILRQRVLKWQNKRHIFKIYGKSFPRWQTQCHAFCHQKQVLSKVT